jgi:hypothetical protein
MDQQLQAREEELGRKVEMAQQEAMRWEEKSRGVLVEAV